ncbi:2-isopropylmalate synthase [Stemphylium lycopersici]|uniref:2-isopropylmalate synthase n=1 Tax=Stemphylium lycopersici TaxID=183478 RepID=A0A364MT57_STELY|nr:2-isopropylmalate synthase [Stemphylium lycopersici]
MSASTQSSATMDSHGEDGLSVEALFLIKFDKKVGYTIAWKRTATPDIGLENAVEYKSLPSGLHSVPNDLVYFTHEGYAGLSAFAKGEAGAEERNANFVSVGILVKKEGKYGRLGRGWLLAGRLEKLAAALAADPEAVTSLDDFWQEQTAKQAGSRGETNGHSRARAISTVSAVLKDEESLPEYHPALSIQRFIDTFGPLVFRLQQAALLRKRILFVGIPPVRTACEFVYNLSVLSSISPRDTEHLIPGTEELLRLPCLFSVGVHDIPYLEDLRNPQTGAHSPAAEPLEGWAACTTDEIITTKPKLYDIIVELPHIHDAPPQERRWPRIRTSDGSLIKASQRDVARYRLLHKELFKQRSRPQTAPEPYTDGDHGDHDDQAPLLSRDEVDTKRADDDFNEAYDDTVVEPMTWSRLAYMGYMWWASAGEKDAYATAERETDRDLIGDLSEYSQSLETAIIAYFHRQSSLLIRSLSQIIEADQQGERDDEDADGDGLIIDRDDLSRMGLDTWSEADRAFVQEFGSLYFGRTVGVKGSEVDCCGLRVPVF